MRLRTVLMFFGLGALWGSQWMLETGVRWLPPLEVDAARYLVAGVVLLPTLWAMRGRITLWQMLRANLPVAGLLLVTPSLLSQVRGGTVFAGWVPVMLSMVPLLIALMQGALGEWLVPAMAGVCGVALLCGDALSFSYGQVWGVLLQLLSSVAIAYGTLMAARRMRETPVAASTCVQMLSAAAVLFLLSRLGPRAGEGEMATWSRDAVLAVVIMGITGMAMGYLLLFSLLRRLRPVQVGGVQWLAVLAAVAESGLLYRQRPGGQMVLGAALAMGATVWLLRTGLEPLSGFTLGVTEVSTGRGNPVE